MPDTVATPRRRVITPQARLLRDARRDRGLTLRQVEERTGLNRAVLSQLENGLRAPTGRQIQLIANALDVRVSRVVVRVYLAIEEPAVR